MANLVVSFVTLTTKASAKLVSGNKIPPLRNGTFQSLDHMVSLSITIKMALSKLKKVCTLATISAGTICFRQCQSMIIWKTIAQPILESTSKWLKTRENEF